MCGEHTWSALVEAGFSLGERLVYLTSPMMRGDDVAKLQLQLGALGFDAGRVDGIFGPITQRALREFQHNVGLVADEVCGRDTVDALARLQPRAGHGTVAGVRERQALRDGPHELDEQRIALVHLGDAEALCGLIGADLGRLGATTAVFTAADWSSLAREVNGFDATACLALSIDDAPRQEARFFETDGFRSFGGERLAERLLAELPRTPTWSLGLLRGMRLPILRETRPPTVVLKLGPAESVDEHRALISSAVSRAITTWVADPA